MYMFIYIYIYNYNSYNEYSYGVYNVFIFLQKKYICIYIYIWLYLYIYILIYIEVISICVYRLGSIVGINCSLFEQIVYSDKRLSELGWHIWMNSGNQTSRNRPLLNMQGAEHKTTLNINLFGKKNLEFCQVGGWDGVGVHVCVLSHCKLVRPVVLPWCRQRVGAKNCALAYDHTWA